MMKAKWWAQRQSSVMNVLEVCTVGSPRCDVLGVSIISESCCWRVWMPLAMMHVRVTIEVHVTMVGWVDIDSVSCEQRYETKHYVTLITTQRKTSHHNVKVHPQWIYV